MRMIHRTTMLFLIIIISPSNEAYRILGVFTHNVRSHFMMFGALMKELAARGHKVDVVSHFPLKNPAPNYTDVVSLAGLVPDLQNNVTYESMKLRAVNVRLVHLMAVTFGENLCDFMDLPRFKQLIENPPQDPPYDLVITEVGGAACYYVLGSHLKVPVVGLLSSAMLPWTNDMIANRDEPAYIPHIHSGFVGPMNFWQRLINTVTLIGEKLEFNYYIANQDAKVKKYFGPHAPSIKDAARNVSLILVNSHYSLTGARPFTTAVVEVGGLHIPNTTEPLPQDLQEWLDNSRNGFMYISFGSMVKIESFPKKSLGAIYASLAKLAPVRVLMKIAKPEELSLGLPSNVLTRSWIPQLAVLKHKNIRAFMTHGGLMGTQESIYCGVPMIGVPLFADQIPNMKLYVEKNVAVSLHLEKLTEENLDTAFNTVLKDPSYTKAVKKLSEKFRDRPMSPMDTAVFWIEHVARHGGADLRSPALQLTWWQIELFDVYGTLLLVTALALYAVVCIMNKLKTVYLRSITREIITHEKKWS